jgi:hypothetical protein
MLDLDAAQFSQSLETKGDPKNAPFLPEQVFHNLPNFFEQVILDVEGRARDMTLISTIGSIGSVLRNVQGQYDRRIVYPTLNVFVAAPPASDKQVVNDVRKLYDKTHQMMKMKAETELARYKVYLEECKAEKSEPSEPPPPKIRLLIPANCSNIVFLSMLKDNSGYGLVIETEADTLVTAKGQSWGVTSETLRCNFHHEFLSAARVDQEIELAEPKASIILSGTFGQLASLNTGVENGEFSRIAFYVFDDGVPEWRDPSPFAQHFSFDERFAELGEIVYQLFETLDRSKIHFNLTKEQWQWHAEVYGAWMNLTGQEDFDVFRSTIARNGLICYRIAMILTVIRAFESDQLDKNLTCANEDFFTALSISKTTVEHTIIAYNLIPKTNLTQTHEDRVAMARELHSNGMTMEQISNVFHKHKSTISRWLALPSNEPDIDFDPKKYL